jgi:hypothetical protein
MKVFLATLTILVALVSPVRAGAEQDLRIDKEKDSKRNTIFKLVNAGSRPIVATIEHRKDCPGVTTNRPPRSRSYLVASNSSLQLRKVWSESSCEHEFRVVRAAYQKPR